MYFVDCTACVVYVSQKKGKLFGFLHICGICAGKKIFKKNGQS